MSRVERDVPPAGEEIHLPGGSLQPIAVTAGITLALLGLTTFTILVWVGLLVILWAVVLWIRDARREMADLPLEHHH
ncbi:MAG: hypothetical protein M3469_00435 [Actinomycetota bacterium]|nr:hypothetical protein [Solirubrobacterales bacterium]MDQ3408438.1 hypothetical protein [Actinomycetota bacterium]